MKKEILMLGLTPPLEGGSERHIYEISKNLQDMEVLTQKGSLCERKIEMPILEINGFVRNVSFLVSCFFYSLFLILTFKKKYDVIHIHENLLYAITPLLKLRYNVVITVHGITGFKFYDKKYLWKIFGFFLSKADRLIAVNKEDLKILGKEFEDVVYIPNGVDLSEYRKQKSKIKKEIAFIGRIHEQKGITYLLEAFTKISDKNLNLKIMGEVNDYAKFLKKKFPDKRIKWLGYMSDRKKIVKELKESYCIILPSLWEGLPLTLFEALASERPVIVSNIKAFKSVIKDEAIFFESKNTEDLRLKIESLLRSKDKARETGKKGLKLAEKYEWRSISTKTLKAYQNFM